MDEDHPLDGIDRMPVVVTNGHSSTSAENGVVPTTAAGPPRAFSERDVSILRLIAQYMQDLGLRSDNNAVLRC